MRTTENKWKISRTYKGYWNFCVIAEMYYAPSKLIYINNVIYEQIEAAITEDEKFDEYRPVGIGFERC